MQQAGIGLQELLVSAQNEVELVAAQAVEANVPEEALVERGHVEYVSAIVLGPLVQRVVDVDLASHIEQVGPLAKNKKIKQKV